MNIIKFPKEKIKTLNEIYEAFDQEAYLLVVQHKDNLLAQVDVFSDTDVYDLLVEAYFYLRKFSDVIIVVDELIKKGYESYHGFFYMMASLIALEEIYQVSSLIRRSKLLNDAYVKSFIAKGVANYSQILSMPQAKFIDIAPCVLLINYMQGIVEEDAKGVEVNTKYLLLRFFDMLNMIYEYGYDEDIINQLENAARIIFEIEV